MRRVLLFTLVAALLAVLAGTPPAAAQRREYVQLQQEVTVLKEELRALRQSHEEKSATLKTLVEQALDAVNRMQTSVSDLSKGVQESRAHTQANVDSLSTRVEALSDSIDELRARLGQMSNEMAETRSVLESVDARLAPLASEQPAPPAAGATPPSAPAQAGPPSADVLYNTALRDFIGGNYELARQEFADYLRYYANTQLAGNAQFYIGETYYHEKEFRAAIAEYDKVFKNHPNSYKIAGAYLKKGYALLELEDRDAGVRELKTLVEKFPGSDEAKWARARLERMGETVRR